MTTLEAPEAVAEGMWSLSLYITDRTPRSVHALVNLKRICEERLAGHYELEVVDLLEQPQRAASDQIIAIPTVVRRSSKATRRIIGDLSNDERVLTALGL
jgi:circadian clock protein KaiB